MGRNNHNKIKNGSFRNRKFDVNGVRRMVTKIQKSEEASLLLNAVLLFMPWTVLFSCGKVCPIVYAGADVSTDLDTLLFMLIGVGIFGLAIAFAIMLKGKGVKDK